MALKTTPHPEYFYRSGDWSLWRATYYSGQDFVDLYLKKYTRRETDEQFRIRQCITPIPAFAKAAVDDVKNAIFHRMSDVVRRDGPESYQKAVKGISGGVDNLGSTMNSFIGRKVLPELLSMSKVGVFVDRMPIDGQLLTTAKNKNPYLYVYRIEDIINWTFDESSNLNEFTTLLLRDWYYDYDENGLPTQYSWRYRYLYIKDGKVHVDIYSDNGHTLLSTFELNLTKIPFVIFDICQSLMADIAPYQIALMNMSSADVAYVLQANFPFYTEQYDPASSAEHLKKVDPEAPENKSKSEEVEVGASVGRKYPKGLDRPDFINPSTDPLKASIEKQKQLKEEIRELVNLSLSNIAASAESKKEDQRGLESGLSFIGLVLESGERQIADIWAMYESSKIPATIHYPERYQLRSDEDIQKEIERNQKLLKSVPSKTFKKEIAKKLTYLSLGHKVSRETLQKIIKEIDSAPGVVDDPELLAKDLELGLVSLEYASKLRGYPEGEVEKAAEDHAKRLARIAQSQMAFNTDNAQARGVPDLSGDFGAGRKEKQQSRDTTGDDVVRDKTRGKADSLKE